MLRLDSLGRANGACFLVVKQLSLSHFNLRKCMTHTFWIFWFKPRVPFCQSQSLKKRLNLCYASNKAAFVGAASWNLGGSVVHLDRISCEVQWSLFDICLVPSSLEKSLSNSRGQPLTRLGSGAPKRGVGQAWTPQVNGSDIYHHAELEP